MKKIFFLLFTFLFLFSCTNYGSKIYICGDHPCKNNKELEEYFANNISMEVYVIERKNKQMENRDLVEINLSNDKEVKIKKNDEQLFFLKKRIDDPKTKKNQKVAKLKLEVENKNNKLKKNLSKNFSYKKLKSTKIVHLCKNVKECDIDIIANKINDLGKNKSFPDLTFGN